MQSELYYQIALSRVPKVGPCYFRRLIKAYGSAESVFCGDAGAMSSQLAVPYTVFESIKSSDKHWEETDAILEFAEANNINIMTCLDESYPKRLKISQLSPAILYYAGTADLNSARTLAVVGTRKMSNSGARQLDRLLDPLVEYQPLIISGLAYGVDSYAHRRSLALGLPTLAVMGSGFQKIYPQAHTSLAKKIVASGGGVLSEYPYWMGPNREHFPARNRIVALLSDMTVVVESATKGGSMITARMASEFNKPVGACPGRGGDEKTMGCNNLIKTGRAHLIDDGNDVINILAWKGRAAGRQRRMFDDLTASETQVVQRLKDKESVEIDDLRTSLSLPPAKLASTLLMLEMKGVISVLPGHRYRLLV